MNVSDRSFNELHELISALCDGRIQDNQRQQLEKFVCEDPESRWYYVCHMHLHANLSRHVQIDINDLMPPSVGWLMTESNLQDSAAISTEDSSIGSHQKSLAAETLTAHRGWPKYRRMAYLCAAAALILFFFMVADALSPRNSAPNKVFASVLQQLHTARVISYTAEFQEGGKITQRVEAMHLQPDRVREEFPDGTIRVIDFSKRQSITIDLIQRKAVVLEETNGARSYKQERFLDKIKEYIERIRTNPLRTDRYLGKRNMGDQTIEGYEMRKPTQVQTLWVDVETGQLMEMKIAASEDPSRNVVMRNFQFDVNSYESLFSVAPPTGFELSYKTVGPAKQLDEKAEMIPR